MMKDDGSAKILDHILCKIRPFGYFQKRLFFLTALLQALVTKVLLYVDFVFLNVKYNRCVVNDFDITTRNVTNATQVTSTTSGICAPGEEFRSDWEVPMWMNLNDGGEKYTYTWTGQGCGLILGALISGFVSDLIGRKLMIFTNLVLLSLAQGGVATVDDWHLFLCMRVLVGIFVGGFMVPSSVILVEHMGQNVREVCICTCTWFLGIPLLVIEALITQHWRYLAIVTSSTTTLSIGTYYIYPESFRWYTIREDFSKAEAAIREIISSNSASLPDFTSLYDRVKVAVLNTMYKRPRTYIDLIHSRLMLRVTCFISVVCKMLSPVDSNPKLPRFISSLVYRCLHEKVIGMSSNTYLDMCLVYGMDIPLVYSSVVITRCLGRRWCLFLYSVSSGFALMCILVLYITNTMETDAEMVKGISIFGKLGVTSTIILILLVNLEIYPTAIRCMGLAVGLSAGAVGLGLGRYLYHEYAWRYHYTYPFICYGVLMTVVGFACLLLPETSNKPLPDLVPSRHRMIGMKEVTRLSNAWDAL